MRAPIRLAIFGLPLLLAACWTGGQFYSSNELVRPIPVGLYTVTNDSEPHSTAAPDQVRVSIRPDGFTAFVEEGRVTGIMGFAPLPGGEGRLVAWSRQDGDEEQWYGLLETRGSNYLLTFPECKETRELAESLGAEFQPDPKVPSCRFRDRASLELALRRFALQSHGESARLVPVVKDAR